MVNLIFNEMKKKILVKVRLVNGVFKKNIFRSWKGIYID